MRESLDKPSTLEVAGNALTQAAELVSAELALAKLEVSEKLRTALIAVASMLGAAVFLVVALVFLLQGLVAFLVRLHWPPYVANLAVGGGVGCVALLVIVLSVRQLSAARLAPSRTVRQIKATAGLAQGDAT